MSFNRFSAILLMCGVLSGCFSSIAPLYEGGRKDVDFRLPGLWFASVGWHDHVYLHFMVDHDKRPRLIRISHPVSNRGKRIQLDEFYIFTAKISGVNYLNLDFTNQDNDKKEYRNKYWFVKYRIKKDVLTVWTIKYSALVSAIQAGQIKGTAWLNGKQKRISLKDTSASLVKWVKQTTQKDWSVPQQYKRIKKSVYREY